MQDILLTFISQEFNKQGPIPWCNYWLNGRDVVSPLPSKRSLYSLLIMSENVSHHLQRHSWF